MAHVSQVIILCTLAHRPDPAIDTVLGDTCTDVGMMHNNTQRCLTQQTQGADFALVQDKNWPKTETCIEILVTRRQQYILHFWTDNTSEIFTTYKVLASFVQLFLVSGGESGSAWANSQWKQLLQLSQQHAVEPLVEIVVSDGERTILVGCWLKLTQILSPRDPHELLERRTFVLVMTRPGRSRNDPIYTAIFGSDLWLAYAPTVWAWLHSVWCL
jgi:hypothetical protein